MAVPEMNQSLPVTDISDHDDQNYISVIMPMNQSIPSSLVASDHEEFLTERAIDLDDESKDITTINSITSTSTSTTNSNIDFNQPKEEKNNYQYRISDIMNEVNLKKREDELKKEAKLHQLEQELNNQQKKLSIKKDIVTDIVNDKANKSKRNQQRNFNHYQIY